MQFEGKQPLGVVYITSMDRPDAVLALALLYGLQAKRDSRIGSVCLNGPGASLGTAIFCDLVQRFYTPGPMRNANQTLLPGLALDGPLPPDSPMITAAVSQPAYARSIKRASDTSLPEAVIRNGVIFNSEAVMVLSAPATYLAKSLDLQGVRELYKDRVKRLIVVDSGAPQDAPAMRKVLAEFPSPIFFCGKDIGDALLYPGASIDKDFAWAPQHPIVDAVKAYKPGPYDPPSYDMAGSLYAVHPDQRFFQLSEPGSIALGDNGRLSFTPGPTGKVRSLIIDPAQKDKLIQTYTELASAKPPVPQQRIRPPQKAADAPKPPAVTPAKPD
jgi:hypothetical protein